MKNTAKKTFLKPIWSLKILPLPPTILFRIRQRGNFTDGRPIYSSPLVKTIKIIVVTGTKGKTTTVATVTHILNENNHEALQFGNMGISGFSILSELERREAENIAMPEYLICELSSWQIRDLYTNIKKEIPPFKIVALTSLFADHLNAYSDFQAYKDDKWLLFSSKKTRIIVPDSLIEELEPNKIQKH